MNEAERQALLWKAKVAAWIHDPPEKALVVGRDPAGHEGGTVATLKERLFPSQGEWRALSDSVKRADRWAAAADRPSFPLEAGGGRYQAWAMVDFARSPVIVHPVSGAEYDLGELGAVGVEQIKAVSTEHLRALVDALDTESVESWRRTFLALWRLAPEPPGEELGALWSLLPADTRVPDHSIWEHLGLTSALSGLFAAGMTPALLSVSFGPVQSFIAQARSTSDLWAGSHLLSRVAWEGMRVLCERLGPDAVLFPALHGVPIVDLWLEGQGVVWPGEKRCAPRWKRVRSDSNPLFAAALPNRFVALVPAEHAAELAADVERAVREWISRTAKDAWHRVLEEAEVASGGAEVGDGQIDRQLAGFPEVHWSAVPWTLATAGNLDRCDPSALRRALSAYHSANGSADPGFLGGPWPLLSKELKVEGASFFTPNPGVLYPALYDLLARSADAAKAARPFEQIRQVGYRCSLCGEREWLTTDRELLRHRSPEKGSQEVWAALRERRPGLVQGGERLCALCTAKRLWPVLFTDEVRDRVDDLADTRRYVVSTHTMAMATTLRAALRDEDRVARKPRFEELLDLCRGSRGRVALPRALADEAQGTQLEPIVRRLPALLDDARDAVRLGARAGEAELTRLQKLAKDALGAKPEAYYGLLLMDGDRMGAWLSGTGGCGRPTYGELWHPQIRHGLEGRFGRDSDIGQYVRTSAASPAYHAAISRALNGFAIEVAGTVVEDLFLGKLLYAGGDDLLAMVSVDDLLPVMLTLRCAYSGAFPGGEAEAPGWSLLGCEAGRLRLGGGHAHLPRLRRLVRTMGSRATASIGAVIAHHMAPLGSVLRELRAAERRAKEQGGRDAFSIALVKRSGGTTHLTCGWHLAGSASTDAVLPDLGATGVGVLLRLRNALAKDLSRRAAYHALTWLEDLPPGPRGTGDRAATTALSDEAYRDLLARTLAHQMSRQRKKKRVEAPASLDALACDLAALALREVARRSGKGSATEVLAGLFSVAEFLAREGRVEGADAEEPDHD